MKRLQNFVEYIAIILVILDCYSVISITGSNGGIIKIASISSLFLCLLIRIFSNGFKIKTSLNIIIFCIVCFVHQVFIAFANQAPSKIQYIIVQAVLVIMMMLYFSTMQDIISVCIKFTQIVFLICILSIFFWIFGTCFDFIHPTFSVEASWGPYISSYKSYFGVYYEGQDTWLFGKAYTRNVGIFAEAPMFSYSITIALFIELFRENARLNKLHKVKILVYIASILTAFSITGVLLTSWMLFIKYIESIKKAHMKFNFNKLLKIIIILSIAPILFYLLKDKMTSISGITRSNNFTEAIEVWKMHPIFGIGYGLSRGYASGILKVLVECGILGVIFYIFPLAFSTFFSLSKKDIGFFCATIGMIIHLLLTVVPYKILTIILFVIFWKYVLDKRFRNIIRGKIS